MLLVQHHILESCVTCTASHSRKLLCVQHEILDSCVTYTASHLENLLVQCHILECHNFGWYILRNNAGVHICVYSIYGQEVSACMTCSSGSQTYNETDNLFRLIFSKLSSGALKFSIIHTAYRRTQVSSPLWTLYWAFKLLIHSQMSPVLTHGLEYRL